MFTASDQPIVTAGGCTATARALSPRQHRIMILGLVSHVTGAAAQIARFETMTDAEYDEHQDQMEMKHVDERDGFGHGPAALRQLSHGSNMGRF